MLLHVSVTRTLKGGIGSLFDPCVNALRQRPYYVSRMEVSYFTYVFGTIIRRDLRILLLLGDSLCNNQFVCGI